MRRFLAVVRGLIALLTLAALTVGLPWLLVTTVGNPYPAEGLTLSGRLTDSALIGVIAVVAWVVWAQLMLCVVVEVGAEIRLAVGKSGAWLTRVPGTFDGQQQLARTLVQAVVTAVVGAGVTAAPVTGFASAATTQVSATAAGPSKPAPAPSGQAASASPSRAAEPVEITVAKGDTLWGLAERHLGSGERWREIAELNADRRMPDGQRFSAAVVIIPGWRLLVPGESGQAPVPAGARTVEVEPGETLWSIAEEQYGDGERWRRLYAANRTQVTDPDVIHPGQILDLPGRRTDRQPPDRQAVEPEPAREPASEVTHSPPERVPGAARDGTQTGTDENSVVADRAEKLREDVSGQDSDGSSLAAMRRPLEQMNE